MKILLIPFLPSQQIRATPIARTFAEEGHEVHLINWSMPYPLNVKTIVDNFANSWKKGEYTNGQVIVHKVRRLPLFFPPINSWWFKRQVKALFQLHDMDLVFSEAYFNESEPPLDLPIFYDMVDDHEAFSEIYGSALYKFIFKLLAVHSTIANQIKMSKAVFCVSDELVCYAKRYRHDSVFMFTNGVEDWALEIPFSTGKEHSLVYVTTFGKWSMLVPLMKVLEELRRSVPDISLTLVGDGTEIPMAKRYVKENGLDSWVTFLGVIENRQELFDQVNMHEVCLNISDKNRFRDSASPMKVFEYSALAKKVVSSDLNGVTRLHFDNIFFFNNDSWNESMKSAILEAFSATIDPVAIRSKVRKYTWKEQIENAEQVFRSKLSKS